jgi:hypothetical protein
MNLKMGMCEYLFFIILLMQKIEQVITKEIMVKEKVAKMEVNQPPMIQVCSIHVIL